MQDARDLRQPVYLGSLYPTTFVMAAHVNWTLLGGRRVPGSRHREADTDSARACAAISRPDKHGKDNTGNAECLGAAILKAILKPRRGDRHSGAARQRPSWAAAADAAILGAKHFRGDATRPAPPLRSYGPSAGGCCPTSCLKPSGSVRFILSALVARLCERSPQLLSVRLT